MQTLEARARTRLVHERRALLATQKDRVLSAHELRHPSLGEIDEALRRIAAGRYGLCTRCGFAIGMRRLRAAPETELCRDCAGEDEVPL